MILSEVYGLKGSPTVQYNGIDIPIWQWGILALIGTWVVIVYMVSVRVLFRHKNKIRALTEYYFGFKGITEYHIYLSLSYVLLIALGLYAFLYLKDTIILVGCIFIPLIYLCLLAWANSWQKNEYQILADTEDYNKRAKKKHDIIVKQAEILSKNTKFKDQRKDLMMTKFKSKNSGGFFENPLQKVNSFLEEDPERSDKEINIQNQGEEVVQER